LHETAVSAKKILNDNIGTNKVINPPETLSGNLKQRLVN
jgi:hypothetical protein